MFIILSIGNLPVGFEIRSKEMLSRIKKRYAGFIQKKIKPHITLKCTFSSRSFLDNEEIVIKRDKNKTILLHRSDFSASFNDTYGEISMRRSIYSFDAFLRVFYSILFTANNGLLLHASGVVRGKRGYLFPGRSGSGKTTVSRLSQDKGTVVNDEIVAVRIAQNGAAEIYGTPFWGEMHTGPAYNRAAPLQGIYFLKKSRKVSKALLTKKNALTKLLQCCCIFSTDQHELDVVLRSAAALVQSIPVCELHFKKDNSFWDVL